MTSTVEVTEGTPSDTLFKIEKRGMRVIVCHTELGAIGQLWLSLEEDNPAKTASFICPDGQPIYLDDLPVGTRGYAASSNGVRLISVAIWEPEAE